MPPGEPPAQWWQRSPKTEEPAAELTDLLSGEQRGAGALAGAVGAVVPTLLPPAALLSGNPEKSLKNQQQPSGFLNSRTYELIP